MTFRLVTLLYTFALFAASLAVFGARGIVVAVVVLTIWIAYVYSKGKRLAFWSLVGLLVVGLLFYPAVQTAHGPNYASHSLNRSKQLLLAIQNFHDTNKTLPPPYVADDAGRPLYSWRVLLLPYLDGAGVYEKLHLDEPWDSPHNRKTLSAFDADVFQSPRLRRPGRGDETTDFVAVVGPDTVWPQKANLGIGNVGDGLSNTVALLEVGRRGIHWAEPRDVTEDEALDLLTGQADVPEEIMVDGYFTSEKRELRTRIVGFLDGHVEGIGPLRHRADAQAMLTRAGGEPAVESYEELGDPPTRHLKTIIHWHRVWGAGVCLSLVVLPAIPAAQRRLFPPIQFTTVTRPTAKH